MQNHVGAAGSALRWAEVSYEGRGWPLFWLALKTLVLTVLTLGIYRFWMKTRLRRHYWSSVRINDEPLEYTGTAVELLLGFLLAMVVLAVYLGLMNLALAFIGMSYFQGHPAALNLSLLALAPLVFYAQYRARRYLLSRTRWRGIRFGAGKGAVGYAWRACLYALATVASLGLLYPWMQFRLAKYATDRTWFGDLRFTQKGRWTGLMRYWLTAFAPVLLIGAALAFGVYHATGGFAGELSEDQAAAIAIAPLALVLVAMAAMVFYNARAFRYLNSHRVLDGEATLESDLGALQVYRTYIVAFLKFAVASAALSVILGVVAVLAVNAMAVSTGGMEEAFSNTMVGDPGAGNYAGLAGIAALYLFLFTLFSAFTHAFLTQPLLRLHSESLALKGAGVLDRAAQRAGDRMTEAEGFADALDVGAAF